MSQLENLSREQALDLLHAYDNYIITASDANLFRTGWVPVCIEEFYDNEYQNVWLQGQTFDYMSVDQDFALFPQEIYSFNGARVFFDDDQLMCQFDGEETKRPLRSRIQDIDGGDAFLIGSVPHYAHGPSHQNFDEPDDPWIVVDIGGDSWFEEDIADPKRVISAMLHGKFENVHLDEWQLPVIPVTLVRERLSEQEHWSDTFYIDAHEVPSSDLFRAAVHYYLNTTAGKEDIQRTSEDFNWGDAMMYVPKEIWNQYGIYPAETDRTPREMGLILTPNANPITFIVDQDELLIPDSYYEREEEDRPGLSDMINSAKARVKDIADDTGHTNALEKERPE